MRHRQRPYYGSFGSISSDTLRAKDLFDAFLSECNSLKLSRAERNTVRAIEKNTHTLECEDTLEEHLESDVEELTVILENHAPPYGYFGTHEGDGADFGFWFSEESIREAIYEKDVLAVSDTSEVPKDYRGEVYHVNDHGNATLYHVARGKFREVWSLV